MPKGIFTVTLNDEDIIVAGCPRYIAEMTKLSPQAIRELAVGGFIEATLQGHSWQISIESVSEFMAGRQS